MTFIVRRYGVGLIFWTRGSRPMFILECLCVGLISATCGVCHGTYFVQIKGGIRSMGYVYTNRACASDIDHNLL